MVRAAIWTCLLASTTCVLAHAVDKKTDSARDINFVCRTTSGRAESVRASANRRSMNTAFQPRQAYNSSVLLPIDVYMQVLSADGTEQGGDISDATIDAQLQVLDDAFRPVGFKFNLKETIRTVNAEWYYNMKYARPIEREIAVALRKGGNATLNIFTFGARESYDFAWATLPNELPYRGPQDGIFMNGTVFLGGSNPIFNKGGALVHETGHWFGLYHIFGNGCEQSYDRVDDTPIEDQPMEIGGCDIGRNSCPNQPGLDLVQNHMSYSDDDCRTSFTPGQIQRMREQTAKFRGVVYPGIDVGNIPDEEIKQDEVWAMDIIRPLDI